MTLSFRADVPEELRERVVIARLTDKGRLAAAPAKYADGAVTGRASLFGIWCAAADTVNPTVTPSFRSGTDMSGERRIGFRISDDFSGVAPIPRRWTESG